MNITTAKIGNASHLLVTIRSILSDVVSFSLEFFVTHSPMIEEMYTYLSFVIILSVSSSNLSSISLISADTLGTEVIISLILSSFSSNLIAKNLFCSSGIPVIFASTLEIMSSASLENSWVTTAAFLLSASFTAFSAASLIPVPFNAEISTTSQPNFLLNLSVWIFSPLFSTTSIMLTAMITGIPSSINCVER